MSITITMLGHAGIQIKTNGEVIYIDLEKSNNPVEKADIILVTHSHYDHCDPNKIKKVRKADTAVIAPADCKDKIGGQVVSLKADETTTVGDIRIRAVHAYNIKRFRSPGQPFHPKGFGVGYILTIKDKTIYHAGDSDFIPEMKELGPIDVALLPVGGTYTMDNDDGADAAIAIAPKVAIGIHTWNKSVDAFKKKVESNSDTQVVILGTGDEYTIT